MDQDWRTLATQRAEYVSDRIRGLLSSGLDFLRLELGVDLGIKPEQYPSWLILSTALIGLIVLVLLVACGRRKRRAVPVTVSPRTVAEIPVKTALPPKTVKTEPSEPKKKNKKKASDKTKKNKKKPKPEVKPTKAVSSTDGKEPDEAGAWETKVSNREKRQQRKKEKGPGDSSGSPEAGDHASQKVEQPVVTATAGTKKNKESSRAKAGKGDVITAPVTSNCNDVNSVNGGGLMEEPVKSTQTSALNNEKLSTGRKTLGQKNRDNTTWKLEPEGAWTSVGVDGRIKAEPNPVNLTMLRLNPSGGETRIKSNIEIGKWDNTPTPDNEWSSSNGLSAVDPSSDWNAPAELWGNYEPKVDAPALKEIPVSNPLVESNDDKDQADPAGGGKSKRRKKKKRPEEEGSTAEVTQEGSAPAEKSVTVKLHPHVPKDEGSKQNIPPQSSSKKSDQNWEPPKEVQKKKARRET
ncbi:metadherin a isoform X6 [Siphateles boraxobius]|uniref:metadherin a isoform X6 n=1 Tax=Siphateles boraxobius TaxID=180520 RepID=UPI0040645A58